MTDLRDYVAWHAEYDDPTSGLAQRLRRVKQHLHSAFDERGNEPVRVLSVCSGDGRDVLGVARDRDDRARFSGTLVEINPDVAAAARARIVLGLLIGFEVRVRDAGVSDAFVGAVPADVLLLAGIFGNISPEDVARTIAFAPRLCATGADVVWTTRADRPELATDIRRHLEAAGFEELAYDVPRGGRSGVGRARLTVRPMPFEPGEHLFTFLR